jgi:hypothetical protein
VLMDNFGGAVTMILQGGLLAIFVVLMAGFNCGYKQIRDSIS